MTRRISLLVLTGFALALAGCGGEIGVEGQPEGARRSLSAFPDLQGTLEWKPMQLNDVVLAVPYVSFKGYHVSGGDILLPGSPALSNPSPESTPGDDEVNFSELASEDLPDDDDSQAALEAAEEDQADAKELARRQTFGVTSKGIKRWAGRRVPYAFSTKLSSRLRKQAVAGMKLWKPAGVRFVKRSKQKSYLFFTPSDGCSSYLGRVGGKQPLRMASWAYASDVAHEVGHALGLHHEHQRDDRTKHIRVDWTNVPYELTNQLGMLSVLGGTAVNLTSYDLGSIMHYGSFAGDAINPNEPWLTRLDGGLIFEAPRPSARDIKAVKALYK